MKNLKNIVIKTICLSALLTFTFNALAKDLEGNDLYINGYSKIKLSQLSTYLHTFVLMENTGNYTLLNNTQYQQTMDDARDKINSMIIDLQPARVKNFNAQIALISAQLTDIPYLGEGAMGEGDWQPHSSVYKGGAAHIQQDPVYRLDGLNCQTFVQVAMALLHSNNLDEFDQTILKISYGAAGNHLEEGIVHFYNRNNFTSGDFNPVNEKNGLLSDVTAKNDLSALIKTTSATITRQQWFLKKQDDLANTVRVLSAADGPSMIERFKTYYSALNYPNFDAQQVSLTYLPKELLAHKLADGSYQPDQTILDKISTPSIVEIVRDVKKWNIGTKNIRDIIGSELNVSHMGLLYRQTFKSGDVIYQKIFCHYSENNLQRVCDVTPIICKEKQCHELMFSQATNAYPDGYYWYQKGNNYVCSPDKPAISTKYTFCNRVEKLPFKDYITRQQYSAHPFMDTASILGIHVEKLL